MEECFQNRNPGKKVINCRKDDYVVSYKPVLSGGKFCGGSMYFKRSSDIYQDIRHIKDSSYYEITFDAVSYTHLVERIVHDIDPERFMIVSKISEVKGRGFSLNKNISRTIKGLPAL